jgi:hypothetical protein
LFFPQSSARLAHINIGGIAHGSAESQATNSNTDNVPRGDFGLIGLAVMGQNLILNAADHGFNVIAFNRTVSKVDHFLANEAKGNSYRLLPYGSQSMLTGVINRKINRRRTLD